MDADCITNYNPASTKLNEGGVGDGGGGGCGCGWGWMGLVVGGGGILTSPCLPVCPSVRLIVDRIVSALYLPQYQPDPLHVYTSYQTNSEGVLRVDLFK